MLTRRGPPDELAVEIQLALAVLRCSRLRRRPRATRARDLPALGTVGATHLRFPCSGFHSRSCLAACCSHRRPRFAAGWPFWPWVIDGALARSRDALSLRHGRALVVVRSPTSRPSRGRSPCASSFSLAKC